MKKETSMDQDFWEMVKRMKWILIILFLAILAMVYSFAGLIENLAGRSGGV